MSTPPLAPAQTHALFDVLVHRQMYAEVEAFKHPTTIGRYGHPFRKADGAPTSSPLLQTMLNKLALTNPALQPLGRAFWQDKVQALLARLAEAELSESYDRGAIGSRRALATAASSIAEYVARGMLGGYAVEQQAADGASQRDYDARDAADVLAAWDECARSLVYGDLLDRLLDTVAATDRLDEHCSLVRAGHEYVLVNVASFLHHVFVMSPDGQYLVRLLENVDRLLPYYVIKQTLRVGNAASMVNAMVRLVLAKLSVTAMTNWIGLTNSANDGMNLMQQIISTVLAWDTAELQKRASKLEASRDAPDKKVLRAVRAHVYASRERHDAARSQSVHEEKSILAVILETAEPRLGPDSVRDQQHDTATEYYATCLSIRDREEMTKVLCKSSPDVLTAAVRDCVSAMDPVIRAVHNAVDLSATVADAESFVADLIKASKPRSRAGRKSRETSKEREAAAAAAAAAEPTPAGAADDTGDAPTVEDFVLVLRKHAPSVHRFLHHVTKNAPELAHDYLVYAKAAFGEFRADPSTRHGGAGNMTAPLHALFAALPPAKQDALRPLLTEHAAHLAALKAASHARLASIMDSSGPGASTHGPGTYLSRWNALLDSTLISPARAAGPVRRGWELRGGNGAKSALDDKTAAVWDAMRDGWVGLCRALEVMGSG
ncbi:uncharacterized protein M421DRAFT_67235 [Didymella exigua CBS 183.55]|uniref:DUF3818 domain-containing protein n=1 Tax=Didymella exigua CBS 183.55 TaxID=1150837 RepID=A0A6A5RGJ4_9PLEO|nr:uncharacterized protein M421DRAFT_67235 [Didymella exigua CBS 183.55]KAF1926603.1 hypothetical protein M421DRAFT_67235 [Didymella exigua CBS 183.55]